MVAALGLDVEAARGVAVQTPAVAARPRIAGFERTFGRQRVRHHAGRGHLERQRRGVEQNRALTFDQRGVEVGVRKRGTRRHAAQEGHVGVQTDDVGLRECRVEPRQRLRAVGAPDDQLGNHRVVVGRDHVAFAHACVDTHRRVRRAALVAHAVLETHGAFGRAVHVEPAGGGQELRVGVFGADARLDRVAVDAQFVLQQRQRLARGHAQLPLHEVEAGDRFGHRVLDLQPGVHLHEKEAQVAICSRLGDELDRACTDVTHGFRRRHRRRTHLSAAGFAHAGRRRFFEHFLVAPLHRTITLEQIHTLTLRVAEHLDLDVARPRDITFDQHGIVTEAVDRFALARRERGLELFGLRHDAHSFATTARAGLDQHRVTDGIGFALEQRQVLVGPVVTRYQRHTGLFHQLFRSRLQTHGLDGRRRWPDEDEAGVGAGLRETVVLAQEAVTRVHRLRAGGKRCLDDARAEQVTLFRRRRADVHGLVAGQHVLGVGVGIGEDRDGANAELARGGRNPAGNLATVGYEDLREHGGSRGSIACARYARHAI